jgi:poly(hydroxyalkanoate) granule-associated protein
MVEGVQQIWLAGMGALARAQRDGPAAFHDAVTEGLKLLERSRSGAGQLVRDAIDTAQGSMQARIDSAMSQANETWDSLETLFQNRVQRALMQIGVPTAEEVRKLTRRVADLNESVKALSQRQATPRKRGKAPPRAQPGVRPGAGGAPDRRGRPGSCSICNPPPPGRAVVVDSVSRTSG